MEPSEQEKAFERALERYNAWEKIHGEACIAGEKLQWSFERDRRARELREARYNFDGVFGSGLFEFMAMESDGTLYLKKRGGEIVDVSLHRSGYRVHNTRVTKEEKKRAREEREQRLLSLSYTRFLEAYGSEIEQLRGADAAENAGEKDQHSS